MIFSLGAFLMRSAGSTINDIADRKFDAHVERTRFRPLASGAVHLHRALMFLGFELLLAASLLLLLSPMTRIVALGVMPLVILYPFCKRFTHWPQAVLGAAFNWGMLMAWSEMAGHVPAGAILMWLGAVSWQIGYDTIYGYVDARDDAKLGLHSTALLFGVHGKLFIALFYALSILAWATGGWLLGMSSWYQAGLAVMGIHLTWQVIQFDLCRPDTNFRMFLSNITTGAMLAVIALVGVA